LNARRIQSVVLSLGIFVSLASRSHAAHEEPPVTAVVEAWRIGPDRCTVVWLRQGGRLLPIALVTNEHHDTQVAKIHGLMLTVGGWSNLVGAVTRLGTTAQIRWDNHTLWEQVATGGGLEIERPQSPRPPGGSFEGREQPDGRDIDESQPVRASRLKDQGEPPAVTAIVEAWWIGPGRCTIVKLQQGGRLLPVAIVTSEHGDTQVAKVDGASLTVGGWRNLIGTLTHRGPTTRVEWDNGTLWERTEIDGGLEIFHHGKPFPVSVRPNGRPGEVELQNEDPAARPVTGRWINAHKLFISEWGLHASVEFTGTYLILKFTNGTWWERECSN
jgi:hypothetical protein